MRNVVWIALVLAGLGLVASPALASEGGGAEDLLKPDWRVTVTAIGIFVLLLVLLTKTAWKPILSGLQKREETIRKALDEAAEATAKAKAVLAEYEQRLGKAAEEAQSIIESGRKDGEELKARIERDASRHADETMAHANREIEQAARKAHDEILRSVAGIVTEAASRVIRRRLDPDGHAQIVDEVVREFAASGPRADGTRG